MTRLQSCSQELCLLVSLRHLSHMGLRTQTVPTAQPLWIPSNIYGEHKELLPQSPLEQWAPVSLSIIP